MTVVGSITRLSSILFEVVDALAVAQFQISWSGEFPRNRSHVESCFSNGDNVSR